MAEEDDKYELQAMNEEQAQAWFKIGGDHLEKMEPRDISNLQLAMDRNPEAFSDAQRAQVKDIAWKKIENVAQGKVKLNPKETNNFKSMLDHVPATTFIEGKDLETFKAAEQKWYNADRGIEEKSFGERVSEQAKAAQQQVKEGVSNAANRVKEGASNVKQHVSEKAKNLANKGKAVNRLRRMQYNRDKAAVKQMFAAGKAKAIEFKNKAAAKMKQGAKTAAEVPFVLAFGVKELGVMAYNGYKKLNRWATEHDQANRRAMMNALKNFKNGIKNRVSKVKNKVNNGVNKVKNFGKKVWNGTKKAALVTGYIVASPVILPYKAGKWVGKKIKNGVNWVRNGYNKLKAKAFGGPTAVAQDANTAEKQAKGNQNKLSPEQVMANWKQIGRGESDGRYNMSRHSESLLDSVMKGEVKIDKANAGKIAAWLEVNRDIQDRINHNNVKSKNERNQTIAAQLEQFGIKNPYKTEETQANEASSQTPPAPEKPKEQEQPAPQPVVEKPQAKEVPHLNPEQAKLVQSQLGILKKLGEENGLKPNDDMYKGLVGMMEKGFAEKGITPEQMEAIREHNPTMFPAKGHEKDQASKDRAEVEKAKQKVNDLYTKDQPAGKKGDENQPKPEYVLTPQDPAYKVGNLDEYKKHDAPENKPAPDKNNPETFNFEGMGGVANETAGDKQKANSGKNLTPEQKAARKTARQVLAAQGRLKPVQKTAKKIAMDTNTRNAFVAGQAQKRA